MENFKLSAYTKTFIIAGAVLIGLVLVIGAVLYGIKSYYTDLNEISTLSAQGKVTRKVPRTIAKTMIYIEKDSDSQEEATIQVEKILKNTVEYLVSHGFASEDIVTNTSLAKTPDWYYPIDSSNPNPKKDFISRASVELTIKNVQEKEDSLGKTFQSIIGIGATSVQDLAYDIENKDQICSEMSREALIEAKKEAEERIKILGGNKIIKIKSTQIYGSCQDSMAVVPMMSAEPMMVDGTKSMESQLVDFSAPRLSGEAELITTATLDVEYK